MWMCSEKSIKGLSHNNGGVKSQEEQSLSPTSLWPGGGVTKLRSPGEIYTPYCGPDRSLWPLKRTCEVFSCSSSVTGSRMHTSQEPGPRRSTSSFHPQTGGAPRLGDSC